MKKYIITLLVAGSVLSVGCKKWLEIQPKSEVAADVLFETKEGFSIALNGIYTSVSDPSLYGQELKFSFLDVLARIYDTRNSYYDALKEYNYEAQEIRTVVERIWANAFTAIANCNSLLEQIAAKPEGFFTAQERNMLEGETLSLRALLYLDLLRLYAPALIVADAAAVPYYRELSNAPRPNLKTSEILNYLIEDLKRSQTLQRDYDTSPAAKDQFHRFRFEFDQGFYSYHKRGFRMGYYATTALLARVALYAGNTTLAYENATTLINDVHSDGTPTIELTSSTVMDVGAYDRLLSDDIIFALYRKDYEKLFNNVIFLTPNTGAIYGADVAMDYRRKAWYTATGQQVLKYDMTQEREDVITSAIPMIRLSEMYHIAAEAIYGSDPVKAAEWLQDLRTLRGATIAAPAFPDKDAFLDALVNDARREYVGEGQLFFLYKRLNKTVLDEATGHRTLTDEFVVPVPEREVSLEN